MKYLIDTNIFFHTINDNIYGVAKHCKDKETNMCVTETIMKELEPGHYLEVSDKTSREVYTSVNNFINGPFKVITFVDKKNIEGAEKLLNSLRKRFYSWTTDAAYLQKLVAEGKIERAKVKTLKNKDLGECELLAVTKASGGEYIIITNDLGRVCLHPEQNIFEVYKDDPQVKIVSGEEWLQDIEYKPEDLTIKK